MNSKSSDRVEEEQERWDNAVNACYVCGKEGSPDLKLQRCSRCKCSLYCSADCQKKGWSQGHKLECKIIATEKEGTWSLATGSCAMLSKRHRLWNEPTPEAGVEIARDITGQKISFREVYPRNALLGMWMYKLIMLDQRKVQLISNFLMGNHKGKPIPSNLKLSSERKTLLRSIFLVGCGCCGQPTIAEIVKFKLSREKVQKWKEFPQATFFGIDDEKGEGTITFLSKKSKNTSTCAIGAVTAHMNLLMDPSVVDFSSNENFDEFYLFSKTKCPAVALDPRAVERDLCKVFEALNISTYPSIDAIMAATSMRVVGKQLGIPQQYHLLREFDGIRW